MQPNGNITQVSQSSTALKISGQKEEPGRHPTACIYGGKQKNTLKNDPAFYLIKKGIRIKKHQLVTCFGETA